MATQVENITKKCIQANTEMCNFMGNELRENTPAASESEEAGFTQFLTQNSTLLRILFLVSFVATPRISSLGPSPLSRLDRKPAPSPKAKPRDVAHRRRRVDDPATCEVVLGL